MNSQLSLANVDFSDEEVSEDLASALALAKFVNNGYGTYGVNQLVGHGNKTNSNCGEFRGRYGCLNTSGHELALGLLGEKYQDQIYQKPVFYSCHNWTCPRCFRSNVHREAVRSAFRLEEAEKQFGKCEHIIASVPPERYGLSLDDLYRLLYDALGRRGILGGCVIRHAFRLNRATGYWHFSPHFHVLGFIEGGYPCRSCRKQYCSECHGFEGHTRKCFERDGWIVKVAVDDEGVAGERKSIFQTVKYQLSHASIRTDRKRAVVLTWFGVCSYRKLKVKYVEKKSVCPYCRGELVRLRYTGSKVFCIDRDSADFEFESHEDLTEDGLEVWEEIPESTFCRSGSSATRRYGWNGKVLF